VADDHLNKLLDRLESSFDAGVARAEDEAASDLALSLLQDASLTDALQRDGALIVHLAEGSTAPVVRVGADYVACARAGGEVVVPLARAIVSGSPEGEPPLATERSLVSALRELVRRGAPVEVRTAVGTIRGRLAVATADHVVITRDGPPHGFAGQADGRVYVALDAVAEIHVVEGPP
jgi:hypothetical protein